MRHPFPAQIDDGLAAFRQIRDRRFSAMRIRTHGDLHLNQILYTGKDFVFIDFEGELSRPLSERRIKRSALRDVASILCSFQYAAYAVRFGRVSGVSVRAERTAEVERWAEIWYSWISSLYLKGYLDTAARATFLPRNEEELKLLLNAYVIEEAVDELGHDLTDRPDWCRIPMRSIQMLL